MSSAISGTSVVMSRMPACSGVRAGDNAGAACTVAPSSSSDRALQRNLFITLSPNSVAAIGVARLDIRGTVALTQIAVQPGVTQLLHGASPVQWPAAVQALQYRDNRQLDLRHLCRLRQPRA